MRITANLCDTKHSYLDLVEILIKREDDITAGYSISNLVIVDLTDSDDYLLIIRSKSV